MNNGSPLNEELIFAGFGGQGVIMAGKLLAQTAMTGGCEVTYMPSYGAEVRGGTANCMVTISDEPIASPLVVHPRALIAMNQASYNKFLSRVKPGGLLIINKNLIDPHPSRDDLQVVAVPADDIALELKSPKSANMVALGAYIHKLGRFTPENVADCLPYVLAPRLHDTIPANRQALIRGAQYAAKLPDHRPLTADH